MYALDFNVKVTFTLKMFLFPIGVKNSMPLTHPLGVIWTSFKLKLILIHIHILPFSIVYNLRYINSVIKITCFKSKY